MKKTILFLPFLFAPSLFINGDYLLAEIKAYDQQRFTIVTSELLKQLKESAKIMLKNRTETIRILEKSYMAQLHNPQTQNPHRVIDNAINATSLQRDLFAIELALLKKEAFDAFQTHMKNTSLVPETTINQFYRKIRTISQTNMQEIKNYGETAIISLSTALTLLSNKQ